MRKTVACMLAIALTALVGCVTINVYFPEAAAQKAADQFIGSVLDQATPAQPPADNGAKPKPKPDSDQPPPPDNGHMRPSASVLDLLIPAAYAAETPDLRIHTPEIDAIHTRMQQRFRGSLRGLLQSGAVGFTADGLVAVRDASGIPLAQRATVNTTIADENRDRNALYREIANANGHPEWESQIRATFAALWIEKSHAGWYHRSASGSWTKK